VSGELVHAVAPLPADLRAYAAKLAGLGEAQVEEWATQRVETLLASSLVGFQY